MIIKIIILIFLSSFVFMQDESDTTTVIYADSKAPLIISTIPYLNNNPITAAAFAAVLVAACNSDSLPIKLDDPNMAMFLSSIPLFSLLGENEVLLIPSLGQIYNKKIFKSFIMSAMKSYWLAEYHQSKEDDMKDRNRSLWWLLVLVLYGIADAYVDAQFAQEPENNNLNNYNGENK